MTEPTTRSPRKPFISLFNHKYGVSVAVVQEESSTDFWKKTDNYDPANVDEDVDDFPLPPLFEAAPELLAALKAMLEKFGSTIAPGESGADAVEMAVVAIHNAEKQN